MKKIVLSLLALIVSSNIWAEWFECQKAVVDGIYYELYNGSSFDPYAVVTSPMYIEDEEIVWGENDESFEYIGDIDIPSKITFGEMEYGVIAIGDWAFANEPMSGGSGWELVISSITIPNSVKRIGSHAFSGCI